MPFQPGQSGNPGGRSKWQKQFRDALQVAINKAGPDELVEIAESLIASRH